MYASEVTFAHLREAADERQSRELEYRRIAHERAAETTSTSGRGLREFVQRFRHSARTAPGRLSHP
jgi:hypothetical protein